MGPTYFVYPATCDLEVVYTILYLRPLKSIMKNRINSMLEQSVFGVCSAIGEKVGLSENRIRLYFIYTSFLTFGSPVIIYLIGAFWLNIKRYTWERKRSIWEI